ncbi:MAG: sulfite exporter TauE/SafE family protein [Gemmatimonadetes bacterium]|nr:sulfite exporter TauE/SafE family protein [Gemmatimonadota bacterium]
MTAALIAAAIGVVAFLYSAVGHAGASGYIAVLTLAGLSASVVRPTALVLNVLVAALGTWQFFRAGHFRWSLFWPFALLSVPAAYLGGSIDVPTDLFKRIVGAVLLLSAARFLTQLRDPVAPRAPSWTIAVGVGALLGFLAGLTGTGGGIFLTPVMLLAHWAGTKETAAVSAPFILVNSIAGLAGFLQTGQPLPSFAPALAVVAVAAGGLGSYLGSRRFPVRTIRLLLGLVVTFAGAKLAFGW